MSDYTEAQATKLLATNCVCCGRPLVDACSVELGIGPECRHGVFPVGVDERSRQSANKYVHAASLAAQLGYAEKVIKFAAAIRDLGFSELASKVENRFKNGVLKVTRNADITIKLNGNSRELCVNTPFRRGDKTEFINAWRKIPGRWFDRTTNSNCVPLEQREALWNLLKRFFPGKWGVGPKGAFRVPH